MNSQDILQEILSDNMLKIHGLLDIDDFTKYNSEFGFEEGNKILLKLSELASEVIEPDYWFHLGSDEFYFSTFNSNIDEIKDRIFKFMRRVEEELYVTVSVGLTKSYEKQESSKILNKLKLNILTAKQNGKNLTCNL